MDFISKFRLKLRKVLPIMISQMPGANARAIKLADITAILSFAILRSLIFGSMPSLSTKNVSSAGKMSMKKKSCARALTDRM
jgi:hypothetical protein